MLEFFKRNVFINSILLLPYAFILRINGLLYPVTISQQEYYSSFTNWIYSILNSGVSQWVFSCILVFVQALLINRMCIKHKLLKDLNLVPGLIYVLLTASLPDFIQLSPALMALTLIIPCVGIIATTYNNNQVASEIFTSGIFVGIAALLYYPMYYFGVVSFLSILILKSFSFKERLQHLIGIITPTLILLSCEIFIQYDKLVVPNYFLSNFQYDFTLLIQDIKSLFVAIAIAICIIIVIINYGNYMAQKATATQKKIDILYWVSAFSLVSIILTYKTEYTHIHILLFPLSIFLAMSLMAMKNRIFAEIIHFVMMLLVIIVQFKLIQI